MSHPTASPWPSPAPRPGRAAPDLGPSERALAERIAALPRAGLPEAFRERCLTDAPAGRSGVPAVAWAWPWTLSWNRSFAAAAALLLALGVAGPAGSSGGTSPAGATTGGGSFASLAVVDDPSVPLFHGLETFDQLAGSVVAVAPGGGSRSDR